MRPVVDGTYTDVCIKIVDFPTATKYLSPVLYLSYWKSKN
jgi:hypothetical protein